MRIIKASLSALVLLSLLTGVAKAENEDLPLMGIRHRNETTQARMTRVSMAGGLEFFVDGKGFDDMPVINQVQYEALQGTPTDLIGKPLDIDDQIQSATVLGKLAYTMPSISDLMGGAPISSISTHYLANNSEELKFRVKVANTADATVSSCPSNIGSKCEVAYSLRDTPLLHDTVPSQVYFDQEINFVINAGRANHKDTITADMDPVVFIKINGTRCDSEGFIDYQTRLPAYKVGALKTRAGDQHPGKGEPEIRFRVGNAFLRESSKHCNFAGDDCWYVKTHPKIDSISSTTGYTTGGQTLTINGWGLKGTTLADVEVTVDGVACKVMSSTLEKITCKTGAAAAVSYEGEQPGNHGLRQQVIDPTSSSTNPSWNMATDGKHPVVETKLLSAWEDAYGNYTRAVTYAQGWFKAPEAGKYRFFLACNNFCDTKVSVEKFDKTRTDPYTMIQTNIRHWATPWRNYHLTQDSGDNKWVSDWITMEKDAYYKVSGIHGEYTGSDDHNTVAVEFEQSATSGKHQATKETQVVEVNNDLTFEMFNITVKGAMGGKFQILFVNPNYDPTDRKSPRTILSRAVKDTDSAGSIRNAIVDFYGNGRIWGSNIEVTKLEVNDDFETVANSADATQIVFQARVMKLIKSAGFSQAQIVKPEATTSSIVIGAPYTTSTQPIAGNFVIACKNKDGNEFVSREMNIWTDIVNIALYLHWDIPHLQLALSVQETFKFSYRENGLSFLILFQDYHQDPDQCKIRSGTTTPLSGGNNMKFDNTTPRPYGNNLMFEPVPLEMLYHNAIKPQVLVKVNKLEGLCPNFNCDYIYSAVASEITAQALTNGKDITITGTGLPTTDIKVILGNTECGTIIASATEITCSLAILPAAGSWDVELYEPKGLVPVKAATAKIAVALVVSSISPSTGLNQLGGDKLTIAGTGFDKDMSKMTIAFSDSTKCDVKSATSTQLECIVAGFDASTLNTGSPYAATITVNSVNNSDKSVNLLATKQSGQTLSPTSVSPVLNSVLTVTLESTYPGDMTNKNGFSASLVKKSDPTVIRPLYVISINSSAKTVTIKFPGAESGIYNIQLVSSDIGRIDKTPLQLTVEGRVTGISPLTGSYLGGTLVTIDGVNFSTNKLDNPVKAGNSWCFVQTSTVNQITCRVAETKATATSTGPISTFLKASEEAVKDIDNTFTFAAPAATVTGMTAAFDSATNTQKVTVTGTGFTTDHTKIELWMDGQKQQSDSSTTTEAKFTITHLDSESANVASIYFPDGYPTGYGSFKTVAVTPNLVSISPASGSAGGTLLTVTGSGFGSKTAGLTLVDSTGTDVCAKVENISYGSFTCMTKPNEILKSNALKLKTSASSSACANSVSTACDFEQLTAGSPTVSAVTVSDATTIAITGTDFPTSAYTVSVIVKGVESSSASIDSATAITATFANGVPVSGSAIAPTVRFTSTSRRMLSAAANFVEAVGSATITNSVTVSASTNGLSCSFQGGCNYEVTAAGLKSTLKSNAADKIDFCGETCVMDEASSDSSKVICKLPLVATTYSVSNYKVVSSGNLVTGTWTGTASAEELKKLSDGRNTVDMTDSTSTDCKFQIAYKAAHVGVLDEAKFFVNDLLDKTPFVGLKLQGSNDGSAFNDLWTVDDQVHEGWNSIDFTDVSKPAYNIYRFQGTKAGSCRIGEVRLHGVESIADNMSTYSCVPKLIVDGTASNLSAVTVSNAKTPVLTTMSTRFGSVLGNESVTFTGTNFSSSALIKVTIDDRVCAVTGQSSTSVTCTTANKPYVIGTPKLVINIDGFGDVAIMGKTFLYVSKWSDPETWGGDLSPQEGEAVQVPKGQHLLFDIDSSPKLSFLNVEGSLIFPPSSNADHERTFDAHYILVKGGYMEVGTEDNRYTSKMTITLWSTKYDPQIPIFGNKVIGVNFGTLDMHGINRPITWSELKTTAAAGATSITLNDMKNGAVLDWKVGEEIVIAPTTYSGRDAEQRTIKTITAFNSNPVITFDGPLLTKHYADIQTYGSETIEMRAEVGLLSRNVVFRGDPEHSLDNQYGAVIICHSPGDESTVCRIDSVELKHVGQAFILGSYPIHFHMIGTVHSSYVRNNAIHHTFNRAVTIHGVHYLRVQNNVAYHTMGHTIFIEDAVESKNLIENNLILDVRRSWSLLNTDQTPASMWITNPDNIIRGNHAGGSDRYSYWYDLQETAIGPSFDANVCPENQKLGEFDNNVAHSNGRYGLRIFHNHMPRTKQCWPINYNSTDPKYNPPIPAQYKNLLSYKNKRNGAIIERAGAVEWHNFKTADNLEVGMEMSRTDDNKQGGWAKIVGGLVVGKSANTEEALDNASPFGVRTPRTEYFTISGTKFYNYNFQKAAGMMTCSHCWHDAATDSGGRTIFVEDLYFDSTVQKLVSYGTPFMTIFFDKTGTMTGKGANSWFLPFYKHLLQPECTQEDVKGGIACDSTVQARRVALHGMPNNFFGMRLKIMPMEEADEAAKKADKTWEAFKDDENNYAVIPYKDKQLPGKAWAMPFVTGHRYRLHWEAGLDFDAMKIEVSEMWDTNDKDIRMIWNHTEKREAVNITSHYGGGADTILVNNNTLTTLSTWSSGDFQMRNATEVREFEILINGKDATRNNLLVTPLECILGKCKLDNVDELDLPDKSSPWSDPATWGGTLPAEDDEVEITTKMWVELDLAETPRLKKLTVNGRLTFKDDAAKTLKSHLIWVRAGELLVGSAAAPFQNDLTIELLGHTESETLTLNGLVKAGNKVLASNNKVEIYGKPRTRMTRMVEIAEAGVSTIKVDASTASLDWVVGDYIFIATSTIHETHSEYRTITAITGGDITLDKALHFYHFGAASSTGTKYNGIDIRNEVLLLTRNIKVKGEEKDAWPGHVIVTDLIENDGTFRYGYIVADNVEFLNVSQKDVGKGGIRFEGAIGDTGVFSKISNSAIHSGQDWGLSIVSSNNIQIVDNVFVGWRAIGIRIDKTRNLSFTGNFVGDVKVRDIAFTGMTIDKEACVAFGSYTEGTTNHEAKFSNNIAAGCPYAGFVAPAYAECGGSNDNFKDNVAHSVSRVGAYVYANPVGTKNDACVEWSHFSAYKTQEACAVSVVKTQTQKVHHITCIDVQEGLSVNNGGQESETTQIVIEDSKFFGESESKDCSTKEACHCKPKYAFQSSHCNNDSKQLHPTSSSALPISKAKGEGNWGGKVTINRCHFKDFVGKSMCGERSVVFERNHYDADKIPPHFFNDITFENVDDNGWAFLDKPNPGWANVSDCGNFPCTAPNNLIFSFTGTIYSGATQPTKTPADFVIIPDDKFVGGTYPSCTHFPSQQIYVCELSNIGLMMFENLDDDAWDRAIQPVYLKNEETEFKNTLNAMMDHIWDGFYTGQKRMARFPAALLTGQDYDLEFSGSVPKKLRFSLDARTGGSKIKIPYSMAGSYEVAKLDNNKQYVRVDYNAWDDNLQQQGPLTKTKGCGENRFVGVVNFLEFFLEPGCDLMIGPKDSIQAKVRMDWTMAEFFSDGGTTRFVDRLASSLGISAHRVKVVAVYKGSVVVDFQIEKEVVVATENDADGNPVTKTAEQIKAKDAEYAKALSDIKSSLVVKAKNSTLNIGAPIMGLEAANDSTGSAELLYGDPIPAGKAGGNPDLIYVPTGAMDFAYAWIALVAIMANLM